MKFKQNIKLRITADQRGKITTGKKEINKQGKEYPKALDHFYIHDFPELVQIYGEKPDKLIILFPSDNIQDFFQYEYNLWGSKDEKTAIKKRECDGEECLHICNEIICGETFVAGEISECVCKKYTDKIENKYKCKPFVAFNAFILDPKLGMIIRPLCYRFESHSENTGDILYTELEKISCIAGGLIKIPFILSVRMHEKIVTETGKTEKRNFPIWSLQAHGTTQQLLQYREQKTLPVNAETMIRIDLTSNEDQQFKQIESKKEKPKVELLSKEQRNELGQVFKNSEITADQYKKILNGFGFNNKDEITADKFEEIKEKIVNIAVYGENQEKLDF